jgi:3-oxoacyl-[acyl-carrier-protein] synthase-3
MHNSKIRAVKISGTGKSLPKRIVHSSAMDEQYSFVSGLIEKKCGIKKRHFVDLESGEDIIKMSAAAAFQAVERANLTLDQIDCLIFAGGMQDRLVPCTAALIHRELGLDKTNIPAYDINSTCISFLVGLDNLSFLIDAGKYKNVLIISADIPSAVMDPADISTYIIFGDGAAAAVISKTDECNTSSILTSLMKTYSVGAPYCDVSLGASHIPKTSENYDWKKYAFHMDGKAVYTLIGEIFPYFMTELLVPLKLSLRDIDMIIPHQASNIAMQAFYDVLSGQQHKLMNIYPDHGNQGASSVVTALHEAIIQNKIKRGDVVMLIGSSAGVSLSGLIVKY